MSIAMQGASGAGERGEKKISEIFLCSISFEIMADPVTTADGQTYERSAIMRWFLQGNMTSPLTGALLPVPTGDAIPALIPNHLLRAAIEQWRTSKYKIEPRSAITIGVQIGVGSFKKVFKGTFHGVTVAVVMMLQGSIAGELEMLIKVSRHPNLLRLLACVMDGTAEQLIITELAPLGALDAFIEEDGLGADRTPSHEAAILLQICNGMIALHGDGIVHCDLACRNILVFVYDPRKPRGIHIKISNLGLSCDLYTRTGVYGGASDPSPVRYMAPEALKKRKYSEKSDVWAFTVLAWEFLES